MATTWSLALQRLRESSPAAVDLLSLACFFGPDDLPLPLLAGHADELPVLLAATAADPLAPADAVAALRRFSLVRVVADGLYVHRLLQTVVRAGLDAEAHRTWATTAVRILDASFPSPVEATPWPECQRLLPHALAVIDHGQRLEVEPEAWLRLQAELAHNLWQRGQYRQAMTLQEEALANCRRVLGDDHPNTLNSMHNLALTRRKLGDLDGARRLFEQALARQRGVLEDHPNTLILMDSLAAARWALGDLQGARELYEQVVAGRRRVLGDDHPDTLASKNYLADVRRQLGELQL